MGIGSSVSKTCYERESSISASIIVTTIDNDVATEADRVFPSTIMNDTDLISTKQLIKHCMNCKLAVNGFTIGIPLGEVNY